MATIVHAADLHIDSVVRRPPDYRGAPTIHTHHATRHAVTRLVDLVLRERAQLLIIAGDVFDRSADSAGAGRFLATQLGRLREAGVAVLVAAGNHDAVCRRATAGAGDVRWFATDAAESQVFDDLGVAVHGQGLADPAEPGDLSAGYPPPIPGYVNLGVLHTSLDGRSSRTICAPTSAAALAARGYDYWALGHVHQRRVVATDPWLVFPGNPQGRGPAEPGPRGATVITTTTAATTGGEITGVAHRITGVAHRELASFRWEREYVDGTGARGTDEMLERVWQRLAAPPVRVTASDLPVVLDITITGLVKPTVDQVRAVTRTRPDLLVHRVN